MRRWGSAQAADKHLRGLAREAPAGRATGAEFDAVQPFWLILTGLPVLNYIISSLILGSGVPKSVTITYDVFIQQVAAGNVVSINSTADSITGVTKKPVADASGTGSATNFSTQRPAFATDDLETLLLTHKVTISAQNPNPSTPFWESLLLGFGPTLLLFFGFFYLMRRSAALAGGGAGGLLGRFGQSGARLYDPERPSTTFADVAGIDEVKTELMEVVDCLKEPGAVQEARRHRPQGRPLDRRPGDRQDAAGAGWSRRGEGPILLHLSL